MPKLIPGVNDLKTKFPDVAIQSEGWDPEEVFPNSNKKLNWKCPAGHIYLASPNSRINMNSGCPYCSGRKVLVGFNDLQTKYPEIAAEAYNWDPTTVVPGTHQEKTWKCNKGHTWKVSVKNRTSKGGTGCPVCSGQKVLAGYNDLQTKYPEIAAEAYNWDPATVSVGCNKKRDWICKEGHIYPSVVYSRIKGTGCPVCSGQKVLAGYNDLQTKYPEIAAEAYNWDPATVSGGSGQKKNWKCNQGHIYPASVNSRTSLSSGCSVCSGMRVLAGFNDLKTKFPEIAMEAYGWDPSTVVPGTHQEKNWICEKGHIYPASVEHRTGKGDGCPFCSSHQVLKGFNDLQTKYPEIAAEAHNWDPATVSGGSGQKKNWKCNQGHIYPANVNARTSSGSGCPYCGGLKVLAGFNDLQTKYPEIAAEAYNWDPKTIMPGSVQKKDWKCEEGHIYPASVNSRTSLSSGCSVCSGMRVLAGFNDLKTKFPEIAMEAYGWDPSTVTKGHGEKKNWKCQKGHIYLATVVSRTNMKSGCPICCEYGFSLTEDAWFYLMDRPGEQQFGITNNLQDRLRTHELNGWNLIEHTREPALGQKVLETEKAFKKWLRDEIGLMKGSTENWSTTKMEVQSLAELKAKSGIDTDLF